jgi:ribonucleoside-diphosphate reductase alpha chain
VTNGEINHAHLHEVTRVATRLLDNVVDLTAFPSQRVNDRFRNNRRIGLADMLFLMKLPYDSPEGRAAAAAAMKTIQDTAIDESTKSGVERGNFPNFEKSVWFGRVPTMRNASLTNVAPTGSKSLLLDVSSGVEPYFALAYRRANCLAGTMEPFVNKHLARALAEAGCLNDEVMDKILETGTLQTVAGIPDEIKRVYVTSLDITAENHILMQSCVQAHCCNAISKKVNFPNTATEEQVRTGSVSKTV